MSDPETFDQWTVIGPGRSSLFLQCRCSCGTIRDVNKKNLKAGLSKSCGCVGRAKLGERSKTGRPKHGMVGSPEYLAWCAIKQRCLNPNCGDYDNYGGRGITVCARWAGSDGFSAFFADMGRRPSPRHKIDRIDNENGGYWCGKSECPDCGPENRLPNCRWSTQEEQNRNTRLTRNVTYNGRTACLAVWALETNIPANVIGSRLDLGWDVHRALTEPVHRNVLSPDQVAEIRRRYDKGSFANGSVALSEEFGVSPQTIQRIVRMEIKRYSEVQSGDAGS